VTRRIGTLAAVAALAAATNATGIAQPRGPAARPASHAARAFPHPRRTGGHPCNASNVGTFDPFPSGDNVTGAENSAVMVGYGNFACDDADVVLSGYFGTIAGNGFAANSFIGAGDTNTIDNSTGSLSPNAFIGGGENDIVSVGNSAIAAGVSDVVSAGQAFAGAGQNNAAGGGYSAILAGSANSTTGYTSFIGAGYLNLASGDGSFVGGGEYQASTTSSRVGQSAQGEDSFVGAGDDNAATGLQSFVGAGVSNRAPGGDSFAGGGDQNSASGGYAFVGAGLKNVAGANDSFAGAGYANEADAASSFIGAGGSQYFSGAVSAPNVIAATGIDSVIGAGDGNTIGSQEAFIGSGVANTISRPIKGLLRAGDAAFGAIAGGSANSISPSLLGASAEFSFVGGGKVNAVRAPYAVIAGGHSNAAGGSYATVPGGTNNSASGGTSFAAGTGSSASNPGTFVWSDAAGGAKTLQSSAANQFLARASGGVKLYSNAGLTSGVSLAAGSGAWASLSDRGAKTRVMALDDEAMLAKVARLAVTEWSYRSEDARVRHAGPMAQDFHAAFGLGEDDLHISAIDESGVALAAIKALASGSRRTEAETHRLGARLDEFQAWDDARFAALARKVARLEAAVHSR
jgi:hypothetical protein